MKLVDKARAVEQALIGKTAWITIVGKACFFMSPNYLEKWKRWCC